MLIAKLSIHLITYIPHAYFSEVLLGVVTCKKGCCMGEGSKENRFWRSRYAPEYHVLLLSYLYASRLLMSGILLHCAVIFSTGYYYHVDVIGGRELASTITPQAGITFSPCQPGCRGYAGS
jgi:hypothetical protein